MLAPPDVPVVIWSDSTTAIMDASKVAARRRPSNGADQLLRAMLALAVTGRTAPLHVRKVKAHVGMPGNEAADTCAKTTMKLLRQSTGLQLENEIVAMVPPDMWDAIRPHWPGLPAYYLKTREGDTLINSSCLKACTARARATLVHDLAEGCRHHGAMASMATSLHRRCLRRLTKHGADMLPRPPTHSVKERQKDGKMRPKVPLGFRTMLYAWDWPVLERIHRHRTESEKSLPQKYVDAGLSQLCFRCNTSADETLCTRFGTAHRQNRFTIGSRPG